MKILFIDTTKGQTIEIAVKDGRQVLAGKKFEAKYSQAEKLLPEIDKILKSKKIKLNEIKGIQVANRRGGFTALRIGVATANALGYALGIMVKGSAKKRSHDYARNRQKTPKNANNFDVIEPVYDKEPNITLKKVNH
ncbi:hypothetical protein COV49_00300 [Candidatus Falkowbacteria bacterium CG11_big_fil_rev_8_21_14_0_20_39_10]|uniref:Gcp-like domain-containing protein n=1 Tax=Candidatus Falkowbacteria bacterium CG11_big_fil_rev_8_21_14_0_20_39_10 TaxID=1974570 RepID=A0A2M6KA45_9BACT|nr:MAG: hypothetical protein COV49_00300 [Candidatus Falkowbacteria bacterium CG11_big_fil_rev_8_21_14_0_20_39_10]